MRNSENEIISIIKYLPVLLILVVSSLLTFFLYTENIKRFNTENEILEEKYISLNKDLIKFQIEKIKDTILFEKKKQIETLKIELKEQVNNAYNIAMSIYKNNQDKTKEEIVSIIKDALRNIRFNQNRGYLFIFERKGMNILHPFKPQLEDTDLWNYQDKKGTFLLKEMDRILLTKKETFYSWYWTKPNDISKEYEKLGFFKVFEPYDWFIGTGEYLIDFEVQLKEKLAKQISDFRYKEDSYIFALDYDGNYISYYNKKVIGKNIYDLQLAGDIPKTQKKMLYLAQSGGGFISYNHKDKPNSKGDVSKISYVDGINDWRWLIGTGFYMDDFYSQLKQKKQELEKANKLALKKLLLVSLFVTIILLFIFMNISAHLENKFLIYKRDLEKQINDNIKKDNMLAHQSKLAAMGEMLGNISHQWRQPLSTISTIVTGLRVQKDLGIENKTLEKESLEKVNRHVQYLSQTIDDFSNFFKPHKQTKEFDLESMINKTIELVDNQLKSNDIELVKDIQACKIFSLENELIQVLINLFNNARDELVKIEGKRYIFINSSINEKNVEICVKDNAGGINEEIISNIFEPYFTTKNKAQGTGIGLFMSEEILVKHLEGRILVDNVSFEYKQKDYKGAEFRIIFPLKTSKTKEDLSLI